MKPGAADTFARARWFWCGIFGELYGSAIESRFAKDVLEVPVWLDDGPEPSTITDGRFRPERLRTLRTRLSAAYKGIHALLMAEGAIDFRSGQPFGQTVFFDEYVDIHHIFPQDWCKTQQIGYARVSKTDGSQSLDRQRDALRAAGVHGAIFEAGRAPATPPRVRSSQSVGRGLLEAEHAE